MKPLNIKNWKVLATFSEGLRFLDQYPATRDTAVLEKAEEQLRTAAQIDPSDPNPIFYLGVTKEMQGKHSEAIEEFGQLLDTPPSPDIEVYYNLGLAHFHLYLPPSYESAIEFLNNALILAQDLSHLDKAERRRRIGVGLLSRSVIAQVYAHMTILTEREVTPEFLEYSRKYFPLAIEEADLVLSEVASHESSFDSHFKPEILWGAYNARGIAYMYRGRQEDDNKKENFQRAANEFEKALVYSVDNFRILSNIGSCKMFLGQISEVTESRQYFEEARAMFQRILTLWPHYDFAHARLAKIALMCNEHDDADYHVEEARNHPSEMSPEYLDRLQDDIRTARASQSS